jgi:hypothetical protein
MKRRMASTIIATIRIGPEIRLLSIAAKIVRFGTLITIHPSKRRGGKKVSLCIVVPNASQALHEMLPPDLDRVPLMDTPTTATPCYAHHSERNVAYD